MDEDLKRKLQIILGIGIVLVGARTAYIMYERKHADDAPAREPADVEHHQLTADDYVYERPFYGYDLPSTKKALVGQTVWMKAGNYFHPAIYDQSSRHIGSADNGRYIAPLEVMKIEDVVISPSGGARQMYAVYSQPGKSGLKAIPVGVQKGDQYRIDVENVLYRQDPRQLYKHWPKGIWDAIDTHEALKGMNEQQVWLALGYGSPVSGGEYGDRRMRYENAGKAKEVQFRNNSAVEIVDAK
jgi:hypothetical protein